MRRLNTSIFLISTALIAFEVSLIQYLSFVQWHHFAALVISIALLGFGASGTVISLSRKWMADRFDRVIPVTLGLSGISMSLAVHIAQEPLIRFDSYLVFVEWEHAAALLATCLVLTVPFLFGALAIGLAFVRHPDDSPAIYFWNLIGSGLGVVLSVTLMWYAPSWQIASICGLMGAAAIVPYLGRPWSRLTTTGSFSAVIVASVFGLVIGGRPVPSQFKDIQAAINLPDARVVEETPSPLGIVSRVRTPVTREAPGLSLMYTGRIPVRDPIFVNGDAAGMAGLAIDSDSTHLDDFTPRMLPYVVAAPETVLILNAGTGKAVIHALLRGALRVTAVEPNALLTSYATDKVHALSRAADVQFVELASRPFLEHDEQQYDLIVLPNIGQFGGGIGLKEMQEEYLFTVEAFENVWQHLTPAGCFSVTTWMDYPYRNPLRLMSMLTEIAILHEIDPLEHIVSVRGWANAGFVMCRSRLSSQTMNAVLAFSRRLGFDPLVLHGTSLDERNRLNQLDDLSLFHDLDSLATRARGQLIENHAFRIDPPTDDKPFFSSSLRWSSLRSIWSQFGGRTTPFFGLGLFISLLAAAQTAAASILLIILPLFKIRLRRTSHLSVTLAYFAALGVGFMLLEIVMIQKVPLYLGAPVFATAVILGTILVGSGLGALTSKRLRANERNAGLATGLIAVAAIGYSLILNPVLEALAAVSLGWRMVSSAIVLTPVAFVMGFPFPLGIRMLSPKRPDQVAWAWGVNGCLSVVAASTAPLIALWWGFTAVVIIATAAYAMASAVMLAKSTYS